MLLNYERKQCKLQKQILSYLHVWHRPKMPSKAVISLKSNVITQMRPLNYNDAKLFNMEIIMSYFNHAFKITRVKYTFQPQLYSHSCTGRSYWFSNHIQTVWNIFTSKFIIMMMMLIVPQILKSSELNICLKSIMSLLSVFVNIHVLNCKYLSHITLLNDENQTSKTPRMCSKRLYIRKNKTQLFKSFCGCCSPHCAALD